MREIDLLPDQIKKMSLSSEEIILDYQHSLAALEFFREQNYACIGFEVLLDRDNRYVEIRNFVSDYPEEMVWDVFVMSAYHQVKFQLDLIHRELLYKEEYEDEEIYFCLTFIDSHSFEENYYDYIMVD